MDDKTYELLGEVKSALDALKAYTGLRFDFDENIYLDNVGMCDYLEYDTVLSLEHAVTDLSVEEQLGKL